MCNVLVINVQCSRYSYAIISLFVCNISICMFHISICVSNILVILVTSICVHCSCYSYAINYGKSLWTKTGIFLY